MQHLGLLFTLLLIVLNLWGVSLSAGTVWRPRWLAVAVGPWLAVTVCFGIETHWGLGDVRGLGVAGTCFSVAVIVFSAVRWMPRWLGEEARGSVVRWRSELAPRQMIAPAAVFLLVLGYAMLWRFTYPNVDGSSEKVADFSYICSYFSGGTIPVVDAWLDPFPSNHYYSFQHYAAALMGRLLAIRPGATYNLAFCVLIALGAVTFAGGVWTACRSQRVRWTIMAAFIVGGTGLSGLVHLVDQNPNPWSSMRFIGSAPYDRAPLGPLLKTYQESHPRMELPGEPFAYSIYLGDFHAPLASYPLLGIGVLCGLLWLRERRRRYVALAGATLTWTLLANTWSLPLQALGLGAWVIWNYRHLRELVVWLAVGAATIWLSAWVYLSEFTTAAAGYGTSIRLVGWDEHTPPLLLLLFLLPTLTLAVGGLLSGDRLGRWFGMLALVLVAVSEFLYIDDIYSGMFNRFNTSLKWWPWIAAATLLTLGPIVLERASRRWLRIVGIIVCLYPCSFIFDLGLNWWRGPKEAVGRIEGHYFLTKELFPRLVLSRLEVEPRGLVIERPQKDGFTNSACLPLFAGHRMWLGWLGHEQLWRGYRDDLPQRQQRLFEFFDGRMGEPGRWLVAQKIDYVLWYQPEDTDELWKKINAAIADRYAWVELFRHDWEGGPRAGFWRRLDSGAAAPVGQ